MGCFSDFNNNNKNNFNNERIPEKNNDIESFYNSRDTKNNLDRFENPNKQPMPNPEELRNAQQFRDSKGEILGPEELDSEGEDQQSFYNQRRRMFYLLSTSIIIISGIYFGLHFLEPDKTIPLQKRLGEVTYIGKAEIGGPWQMYLSNGKTINHKDLAGKYYLIYFGFTMCPDVCPQSLTKIAKVIFSS